MVLKVNPQLAQSVDVLSRVYEKLAVLDLELACSYAMQAKEIKNPRGDLGPLFE